MTGGPAAGSGCGSPVVGWIANRMAHGDHAGELLGGDLRRLGLAGEHGGLELHEDVGDLPSMTGGGAGVHRLERQPGSCRTTTSSQAQVAPEMARTTKPGLPPLTRTA